MNIRRRLARLRARMYGYFWQPCPVCGEEFGGHEWRRVDAHLSDVPDPHYAGCGRAICPACTGAAAGCRAWAEADPPRYSGACSCEAGVTPTSLGAAATPTTTERCS